MAKPWTFAGVHLLLPTGNDVQMVALAPDYEVLDDLATVQLVPLSYKVNPTNAVLSENFLM